MDIKFLDNISKTEAEACLEILPDLREDFLDGLNHGITMAWASNSELCALGLASSEAQMLGFDLEVEFNFGDRLSNEHRHYAYLKL